MCARTYVCAHTCVCARTCVKRADTQVRPNAIRPNARPNGRPTSHSNNVRPNTRIINRPTGDDDDTVEMVGHDDGDFGNDVGNLFGNSSHQRRIICPASFNCMASSTT